MCRIEYPDIGIVSAIELKNIDTGIFVYTELSHCLRLCIHSYYSPVFVQHGAIYRLIGRHIYNLVNHITKINNKLPTLAGIYFGRA
jgi:hypothetical protein